VNVKWKIATQYERECHSDVVVSDKGWRGGAMLVGIGALRGKQIRITVEEAVDDPRPETAWREMLSYGGPEARRIHDAAFPHAPLEPGRNIRIRMEEEVSECCENWRSCVIVGCREFDTQTLQAKGPTRSGHATYCPDCGGKL